MWNCKMLKIELFMLLILLLMLKTLNATTIQASTVNDLNGKNKCERITMSYCQGLGYNLTMMPNLAGHTDIKDANLMISTLSPLIDTKCSKQLRFLICSSLFPLCSSDIPRPVPACRNLCDTVKTECFEDATVKKFWPSFLDCDSLPEKEKHGLLCMNMPAEVAQQEVKESAPAQPNPTQNQNQNHQDTRQSSVWQTLALWKLTQSNHLNNKIAHVSTCPQNFTLNDDGNCVYKCGSDAFYSSHQKKIIETCILVFSVLCFIFTLFSLITFWMEPTRFKFPERPVLFLTLCYYLLSMCYLGKIFYQKSSMGPYSTNSLDDVDFMERSLGSGIASIKSNDNSSQCSVNSQCLAYFIIINYLMLSASFWWLIFGLCWWLSTSKQWSPEALERKSGLFHVMAWLIPLAAPISALLFGAVKTNELTGMCTAPGFTEIPSLFLLLLGALFILLSARSLKSLRVSWKNNKLSQVMSRILIFGTVYFIPAVITVVLMFFDNLVYTLPACNSGEICSQPEKRSINISIVRYFCLLIGGLLSGVWVWSKKTCVSCRKKISSTQYSSGNPSPPSTATALTAHLNPQIIHNGFNGQTKYFHSIKQFNPLHKSLLNNYSNNNNYNYTQKKFISGVHFQRAPDCLTDWIPHHSRV